MFGQIISFLNVVANVRRYLQNKKCHILVVRVHRHGYMSFFKGNNISQRAHNKKGRRIDVDAT